MQPLHTPNGNPLSSVSLGNIVSRKYVYGHGNHDEHDFQYMQSRYLDQTRLDYYCGA